MTANQLSITKFQLFFLMIQTQIGIGVLSLPNVVQKIAKGDGWISTIIAGVAVQFILFIYWLLVKRFPNDSYPEIAEKILGRFLGKGITLFIYLYFILIGSLATTLFLNLIHLWLLPLTPTWVLAILIMAASIYLAISDLRMIARFFVLASSLFLLLLFLSILSLFIPKDITYIMPIGSSGIKNILIGSHNSLISMLGFEIFLFSFPFILEKQKGVLKTISMANLFVTGFYTYFMIICLITFSPEQLHQIRMPLLYLFRGLSYKMIDRVDFIFLSIWIVPMTTSIIGYLFLTSKSFSREKKSYERAVILNGVLIFSIAIFIPHNDELIALLSKYVSYLSYVVVFVIPLFLLLMSYLLKKHERSDTA